MDRLQRVGVVPLEFQIYGFDSDAPPAGLHRERPFKSTFDLREVLPDGSDVDLSKVLPTEVEGGVVDGPPRVVRLCEGGFRVGDPPVDGRLEDEAVLAVHDLDRRNRERALPFEAEAPREERGVRWYPGSSVRRYSPPTMSACR